MAATSDWAAQCGGDITVDVDDQLVTADFRVHRPGGWASETLDDVPPYVIYTE